MFGGTSAIWSYSELDENDERYEIDCTGLTENQVDALVKHGGDTDYMHAHNKLAGVLRLPADFREKLTGGEEDPLYKGEIQEYMHETAR